MEKFLQWAYYNPNSPSYFASTNQLYRTAKEHGRKITKKTIEDWLNKQTVHGLHKPLRRRFPRNKVITAGIDWDWQLDLMDMGQSMAKSNNGRRYILTVIDVFSKWCWAVAIKSKRPPDAVAAFKQVLGRSKRKPFRVFTDCGNEFRGAFDQFLDDNEIQHLTSKNVETKASVVERLNRTIRTRLGKYFTHNKTRKYVNILPKITSAINRSFHRAIKCRPIDVNFKNESEVWHTLYGDWRAKRPIIFKFNVGDLVRIARYRGTFTKSHTPTFTEEVFKISKQVHRRPPVYQIVDLDGEPIEGVFMEQELFLVKQRAH